MNCCWNACFDTFAQVSPFREMGSEFRGRRAELTSLDLLYVGLIVVGVAAGVWLLRRMLSKQERVKPYFSRRRLFRELCRSHGLNYPSRRLLVRLARHNKIQDPAMLFLQPSAFTPDHSYAYWRRDSARIAALKVKLFHWPEGETAIEPPLSGAA